MLFLLYLKIGVIPFIVISNALTMEQEHLIYFLALRNTPIKH